MENTITLPSGVKINGDQLPEGTILPIGTVLSPEYFKKKFGYNPLDTTPVNNEGN
jgi:hypothetical protein